MNNMIVTPANCPYVLEGFSCEDCLVSSTEPIVQYCEIFGL